MRRGNHGSHATRRRCGRRPGSRRRRVPRPVRETVQRRIAGAIGQRSQAVARLWRPVGSARSISRALLLRAGEVAVQYRAGRRIISFKDTAHFCRGRPEECGSNSDVAVTGEVTSADAFAAQREPIAVAHHFE